MLSTLLSGNIDIIETVVYVLSALVIIFLTLPIHEFAHAFIADKLGDPTPRYQRRLTLNPMAHIDYFGALCILIFRFGWAKPVQVNAYNFKKPKFGMAMVALAGPFSNIILSFLACILSNVTTIILLHTGWFALMYVITFFGFVAQINVYLAVFNLLPVPPLDGSRILGIILPGKVYFKIMQYERYIYMGLMLLLFSGALDGVLYTLSNKVLGLVSQVAALPFGLLV